MRTILFGRCLGHADILQLKFMNSLRPEDDYMYRADSRFAPRQWETALLCNDVSYWLGTSLESALYVAVHLVVFGSISGLSPVCPQTTTWSKAYFRRRLTTKYISMEFFRHKMNAVSYKDMQLSILSTKFPLLCPRMNILSSDSIYNAD